MITNAFITAMGQIFDPWSYTNKLRGDPEYPIGPSDLLEFGRSPLRWVKSPTPSLTDKPSQLSLLRCMVLAPSNLPGAFIRRPDTYDTLAPTCPNCKSVSAAKTCRSCGLKRVNVAVTKDWSASAAHCQQWAQHQETVGIKVIPPGLWDATLLMAGSFAQDSDFADLRAQSDALCLLQGTWHDADTGLDLPLHSRLDLAPREDSPLSMATASLGTTLDASPGAWAKSAFYSGLHLRAAFQHALFCSARQDTRSTHLWSLCERSAPYLTARRRASPELLDAGRSLLGQLLGAYARCLATRDWPAFDVSAPNSVNAWSEIYLEPWMTQGDGGTSNYFALGALPAAA